MLQGFRPKAIGFVWCVRTYPVVTDFHFEQRIIQSHDPLYIYFSMKFIMGMT